MMSFILREEKRVCQIYSKKKAYVEMFNSKIHELLQSIDCCCYDIAYILIMFHLSEIKFEFGIQSLS